MEQVTEKDARRAIRGGMRSILASDSKKSENVGDNNTDGEEVRPAEMVAQTGHAPVESGPVLAALDRGNGESTSGGSESIEQWLDRIQQGYGALYSPIFAALVSTVLTRSGA